MGKKVLDQVKYPSSRLKGIGEFMTFIQEPSWKPATVDIALMRKLNMAKGKEGEAVYALKFLGVIDGEGQPTSEFDNLKRDYQGTMKRLVEEKYSELFSLLPAKLVNQVRLVKFFGGSIETAEYQAKIFVWFCEQAGIDLPNVEKHFHRARFDKRENQKESQRDRLVQ